MRMMKLAPLTAVVVFAFCSNAAAGDCDFDGAAPTMPDPATATDEDMSATIDSIKAFQAELGDYRACLEAITTDTELDKATRKAALDKFNDSVDMETAMVEDWQAFRAARKEAQG